MLHSPTHLLSPTTRARIRTLRTDMQAFSPQYTERFYFPTDLDRTYNGNSYASSALVLEIRDIFNRINAERPEKIQSTPALKQQFQEALMNFHKKLVELEVTRTKENQPDLDLSDLREAHIGSRYDTVDQFKAYVLSHLDNKHFLIAFRYLFPLAGSSPETPVELEQSKVKSFMDSIQKVFTLLFCEPKPSLSYRSHRPGKLSFDLDSEDENQEPNPRAALNFEI